MRNLGTSWEIINSFSVGEDCQLLLLYPPHFLPSLNLEFFEGIGLGGPEHGLGTQWVFVELTRRTASLHMLLSVSEGGG